MSRLATLAIRVTALLMEAQKEKCIWCMKEAETWPRPNFLILVQQSPRALYPEKGKETGFECEACKLWWSLQFPCGCSKERLSPAGTDSACDLQRKGRNSPSPLCYSDHAKGMSHI